MLEELKRKLNDEAEQLHDELHNDLPKQIEEAVDQGDLSENAEYEAARDRQRMVQAKLRHIARRLSELEQIDLDTLPEERVGFGSRVVVEDLGTGETETFKIALGDDIDFEAGEVSMDSPIGEGLLGCEEGDEVSVRLPTGRVEYRIVELETLPGQLSEE